MSRPPELSRPPASLVGDRIRLDRTRARHAPQIAAAVSQSLPELMQFMDWAASGLVRPEDFADFIAQSHDGWEQHLEYNFVVISREPGADCGRVIGGCGLMRRVGPAAIEIGYWIRSDQAGRGLATEAAGLLVNAAWTLSDVARIEIIRDGANEASGRVADKLGFNEMERRAVEMLCPGDSGIDVVHELLRPMSRIEGRHGAPLHDD